jgi:hypothetical protein
MIDRTELWSRILTKENFISFGFWSDRSYGRWRWAPSFFTYCAVGLGKREVSGDLREILMDGVSYCVITR